MANRDDLKMYFDGEVVREFVARENNPKYEAVTRIIELVGLSVLKDCSAPWRVADLGAGGHPERFVGLRDMLGQQKDSKWYWVDVSGLMLDEARKALEGIGYGGWGRIEMIEADMVEFLVGLPPEHLSLIVMKYTFEHVSDLENLFEKTSRTLQAGGGFVANLGMTDGQLPSLSHNARFLFEGREFPIGETRTLNDGDEYGVKFLKSFGDVSAGYLDGAQVTKYYHSREYICRIARKYGLSCWMGSWRDYDDGIAEDVTFEVEVMVVRKLGL